ncbi:MAG TPA: FabA/FabZ family ACP-dehydratase [Spongiibacteraceae bacterium]|jgi:3-hydroxyacyl-[acyl-carrier-protein] dehydratase
MDIRRFNMIDEISFLDTNSGHIECRTSVASEEEIFKHHFPAYPVLPGAYLIESMAQCCAHFVLAKNNFERLPFLVGVERSRFKCFIAPGDELVVNATKTRQRGDLYHFDVQVHSNNRLSAEARITMSCMCYPGERLTDLFFIQRSRTNMIALGALQDAV